jgi:hypothetical protein
MQNRKIRNLLVLFLFGASSVCFSQGFRLDVNVRGNVLMPKDDSDEQFSREWKSPAIGFSGEVLYFPLPYLGAGPFYSRSISDGKTEYENDGGTITTTEKTTYRYAAYGLAVQGTTNRSKLVRGFGVIRVGNIELLEEFEGFSVGDAGLFYSVGAGVIISVTQSISVNVIEANYCFLPKKLSLENTASISAIQLQAGVVLKLWRIK